MRQSLLCCRLPAAAAAAAMFVSTSLAVSIPALRFYISTMATHTALILALAW